MAFHQVEFDPKSRVITTFIRPSGFFYYNHLLLGINTATEKFQHIDSQRLVLRTVMVISM